MQQGRVPELQQQWHTVVATDSLRLACRQGNRTGRRRRHGRVMMLAACLITSDAGSMPDHNCGAGLHSLQAVSFTPQPLTDYNLAPMRPGMPHIRCTSNRSSSACSQRAKAKQDRPWRTLDSRRTGACLVLLPGARPHNQGGNQQPAEAARLCRRPAHFQVCW